MFEVKCVKNLAEESPDHMNPHGTKFCGTSSELLKNELETLFPDAFNLLSLGCSGGRWVRELLGWGHEAVGLEGSDYHASYGTASWGELHGKNLFTCDISYPFEILKDGRLRQFDIITLFDVFEHITEAGLVTLCDNIVHHLREHGIVIATICLRPSPHPVTGVELHQTVQSKEWWLSFFRRYGFDVLPSSTISKEAWDSVTCWHGKNRDQNWAIRVILSPAGGGS